MAVLPYLEGRPEVVCSRDELKARLWAWFGALPYQVQIACDSVHDRDLLWDALDEGLPANLDPKRHTLASVVDSAPFRKAVFDYHAQPDHPWHHALHDAQANRVGWLAWMATQKQPS